jgi:ribose 1,5-bisphosphokinase PhnN
MPHLIVIYGPPLSGKSTLARALGRSLPGPTAIVSADHLTHEAIAVHSPNVLDEMEMVTTQIRLMVANYLKSRYNVVLEGAFSYERDGHLLHREQEIDQVTALMRNLAPSPLVVQLTMDEAVLRERAGAAGRENDIDVALRISNEYRARYGRWLQIDTGVTPVFDALKTLLERLNEAEFP